MKKQNSAKGGDLKILCIGDSYTYGLGVPREECYPKQLEKILNKTYPDRHIKVINLGAPGYNSSQCLKSLKENFDLYKPEIILVMSGMNNCWNFMDSSYFKVKQTNRAGIWGYRLKLIDAYLSKLKTYKLIKISLLNLAARLKRDIPEHKGELFPAKKFPLPRRSAELTKLLEGGLKSYEEGKYELSESIYLKAQELSAYDYEPHWFMGRFYLFKGEVQKAKEEFLLAAKYAPDPYTVTCILANMQEQFRPINSKYFEEYAGLIKGLRSYWVEKFGEEYVRRFIDPMISYEETDLVKVLFYDFDEMVNYAEQRGAKLVVLTYPFSANKFRCPADIYYRISRQIGAPLVDNFLLFYNYSKIYSYEELFSSDGHCTSVGYGLIAKDVLSAFKKYNLLHANNI